MFGCKMFRSEFFTPATETQGKQINEKVLTGCSRFFFWGFFLQMPAPDLRKQSSIYLQLIADSYVVFKNVVFINLHLVAERHRE